MPKIKASTVVHLKTKIHELGGDAEQRLLARLPAAVVESYHGALPISWLPLDHVSTIYAEAVEILYPGNPKGLRRFGFEVGRMNFSTVYRVLLRVMSVPFLMEHATKLWRTFHTDGQITTEPAGPNKILITVTDLPGFTEPLREVLAGQFEALAGLTGARDVRVSRDDKPPTWRWVMSWS